MKGNRKVILSQRRMGSALAMLVFGLLVLGCNQDNVTKVRLSYVADYPSAAQSDTVKVNPPEVTEVQNLSCRRRLKKADITGEAVIRTWVNEKGWVKNIDILDVELSSGGYLGPLLATRKLVNCLVELEAGTRYRPIQPQDSKEGPVAVFFRRLYMF